MKGLAIQFLARWLRLYFRYAPTTIGKSFLWNRVVIRHLAWRKIRIQSRTSFNCLVDVDLRDAIQRFVYFFGVFEPVITRYITNRLRPGDVFIDVGANIGYYSLLASKLVGPQGKIFAFEASPSIYSMLKKNLGYNNCTNVYACNIAITAAAGRVTVHLHNEFNLGATTIVSNIARARGAPVEASVPCASLPAVIEPELIRNARFIKIDVEGAEWDVLLGLRELLPSLSRETELLVEVNQRALAEQGVELGELLYLLADAGFAPFMIENEYSEEFYIRRRSSRDPRPLKEAPSVDLFDLLFRCPEVDQSSSRA